MALELNDSTFDNAIKSGTLIVDFWAPWCGPCRMQGPILDELAEEVGDAVTIAKVNVDEAQAVAARYGIRAIPTIMVFKDGQQVQQMVGVQPKGALMDALGL